MAHRTTVNVGGRRLHIGNLDKVLYPRSGFIKAQVIDYYARIAPVMLRHLRNHPVSFKRFPDGVDADAFFEKNCPSHRPDWVETAAIDLGDKQMRFCLVQDAATLIWAANLAALELHTYLHLADQPQTPTVVAFDLDPGPPAKVRDCAQVALMLRQLLDQLNLRCIVKASGGKGLHVSVPINTPINYQQSRAFAQGLARVLTRQHPDKVLFNMSKQKRQGKVFIDWSQNSAHKTTVCVYSLRAHDPPTVSAPLTWNQVQALAGKGQMPDISPRAVLSRAESQGDLFEQALTMKQKIQ